jgi:predicted metalloprotease
MDNGGRGSGMALLLLLIVALIVAWLAVVNMKNLGVGGSGPQEQIEQNDNTVDEAQNAVDALNEHTQKVVDAADVE